MLTFFFIIIVLAAIIGIISGLTRIVVTAAIWFVLGLFIQVCFGPVIVGFAAALGITIPLESIPALTAVIGVIHGFLRG